MSAVTSSLITHHMPFHVRASKTVNATSRSYLSLSSPSRRHTLKNFIRPQTKRFNSQRQQVKHRSISITTFASSAQQGDYVEIQYTGTLDDGTVFDTSNDREALSFIVGTGRVVPGFEDAVVGLSVGEKRKQRIEPAKAYGEWTENMTAKVPIANAPKGLEPGVTVQLQNGMPAKVISMDDEFVCIDANHPLAGQALTFEVELMRHVASSQLEKAAFGGGCFWGVELNFQRTPGVVSTEVGYSQGYSKDVTYEQVCSGDSGHAEVVLVTYDTQEVDFEKLTNAFFDFHDPTTLNRQGNDVGSQYRSGIYYITDAQKEAAERAMNSAQERYSGQVISELEKLDNYVAAEPEHQQYLERGGRFGRPQSAQKGCNDKIRCYG